MAATGADVCDGRGWGAPLALPRTGWETLVSSSVNEHIRPKHLVCLFLLW